MHGCSLARRSSSPSWGVMGDLGSGITRAVVGNAGDLSGDPRHGGQRLGPDCELCLRSGLGVNRQVDRVVRFCAASKDSDESSVFSCWSSSNSSDCWVWL
jgi:hypothetical protein